MSLKFVGDPDGYSPGHEYELMLQSMKKLYHIFPKMKVCKSNHTWRPLKKAFTAGIPKAFLRNVKDFMEAPKGWEWAEQWIAGKTLVIHGEGYSSSNWWLAHNKFRQSVILGHVHAKAGVMFSSAGYGQNLSRVFTLNVGCAINTEAYAAAYGKTIVEKPVLGCGVTLDDREAFFIPMPNQNGVVNKIAKGLVR
jgi:hypothetical protein